MVLRRSSAPGCAPFRASSRSRFLVPSAVMKRPARGGAHWAGRRWRQHRCVGRAGSAPGPAGPGWLRMHRHWAVMRGLPEHHASHLAPPRLPQAPPQLTSRQDGVLIYQAGSNEGGHPQAERAVLGQLGAEAGEQASALRQGGGMQRRVAQQQGSGHHPRGCARGAVARTHTVEARRRRAR